MTKADLREQIKEQLQLHREEFPVKSEVICKKILESEEYKKSEIILAYMALWDEVDLSYFITQALEDKKRIFIPRIIPGTNLMDFYEYNESSKIHSGSFGIDEPDENGNKLELKNYIEKILILSPGRAFTRNGERLGRGLGFYDTFLSEIIEKNRENILIAGVCFSWQLVDYIPVESHDLKMQYLFWE